MKSKKSTLSNPTLKSLTGVRVSNKNLVNQGIEKALRKEPFRSVPNPKETNHISGLLDVHAQMMNTLKIENGEQVSGENSQLKKGLNPVFTLRKFVHSGFGMSVLVIAFILNVVLRFQGTFNESSIPSISQVKETPIQTEAPNIPYASESQTAISKESMSVFTLEKPNRSIEVPVLSFESFRPAFKNGVVNFKWIDSEQRPSTYLVEQSRDGVNFEILKVVDHQPGKQTASYMMTSKDDNQVYRLVKIVHGENASISRIFSRNEDIRTSQPTVENIFDESILASK